MSKFLSVTSILTLASLAAAQSTLVAPAAFANVAGGTTGNVWRAGLNRVQCFYDSSNFLSQNVGQPIEIQQLEFRLGQNLQTNLVTYPDVDIYLQLAAVDHASPNTAFDLNRTVAFPTTPNYSGPLTTVAVAGGSPNGYFLSAPLQIPFQYVPDAGVDLLVEIVIKAAPTPATGNTIDAGFNVANHKVNSVRSVGSTTAATGSLSAFAPTVRFSYVDIPGAASNKNYGVGCYTRAGSLYEQFAGSGNDLSNSTVTLYPNAWGGYRATTAAGSNLVLPTGTGLGLGDDEVSAAIALPFTFEFPGGSTNSIVVDSNGSVILAGTAASSIGGNAATMLSLPSTRLCASLQDLLPDGLTNTDNVFAEAHPSNPNVFLITWRNVPCFGATSGTSTFQIALIDNGTTDSVEYRYATLENNSTSNAGTALTGFSWGNGAIDPGSADLTAGLVRSFRETRPLALGATGRPVLGGSTTYTLTEIPANALISGLVLSIGFEDTGFELGAIGMPGCFQYVFLGWSASVPLIGTPSAQFTVNVPNNAALVGLPVDCQAASCVPGANSASAITSNAVLSTIGAL
jgi:hypothetical protein